MKVKELKELLKNEDAEVLVDDHGAHLTISSVLNGDSYRIIPGLAYVKEEQKDTERK